MRTSRHIAALVFGATIGLGIPLSASRAGTADVLQPTERQQQAADVLAKLDDMLVPTREQFVAGSMSFVLFHELAHFLIDEYDIPLLGGREEDVADAYAVYKLSPHTDKEEMQSPVRLWLYYAFLRGAIPITWWDEHSLDHQRAFDISCFLEGRWPERYAGLSDAFGAPPNRTARCAPNAYRTQSAWDEALRDETSAIIHKQQAIVTYRPAPKELSVAETWLRASHLLESIATELQWYRLPDWRIEEQEQVLKDASEGKFPLSKIEKIKIEVIAQSCDEANAFYAPPPEYAPRPTVIFAPPSFHRPEPPRLIVCYELVENFQRLAEQAALPDRKPDN
jgi:hypothetical protein